MSQDGNGSGDELYDEESSSMAQFDSRSFFDESNESVASASSTINTGDEPLRRCVTFDPIPTIFYYQADEPVFPINNSFSRANTPNEQLPRLHRGRRFGSYNNRRAHLYIPNLSTV